MSELTHSWNGTVLTITSDSGTSSMDLKGEKGDDGARGPQGPAGKDGDTTAGATITLDDTLSVEGQAADAKAVGDAISVVNETIENLTAADVGALPDTTVIPSTSGLATETYVDNAVSAAVAAKQNKVYYNTTEPSDWVSGDIWLCPAT